jgi:hypothetical protein
LLRHIRPCESAFPHRLTLGSAVEPVAMVGAKLMFLADGAGRMWHFIWLESPTVYVAKRLVDSGGDIMNV